MTLVYQSAGTAVAASGASPTTIATTQALAVGDVLFIAMAYDNSGGGGADPMSGTFTPTPAAGAMSFNSGSGQTGLNDPGAASAGLATRVNSYTVTTAIPSGTNMSIAWSGTVVVRAIAMVKVSSNAGGTINYRTSSGSTGTNTVNATAPALTTPSVTAGELVLCYAGYEYGTVITGDADTTNGTWGTAVTAFTGSTTSGMSIAVQGKVVTATATQTFNPTGGTLSDWILGALIFTEVIPPAITQAAYRFYDDGTETGSVALAAQDTAPTVNVTSDVNLQLRVRLQLTTEGSTIATDDWQLQFDGNLSGAWTNVTAGVAVSPYASANLTDAALTTERLTGGTGAFIQGKVSEDGLADDLGWPGPFYTEVLYSLTLKSADLATVDTLRFRVLRNFATTGMTFTVLPTINCTRVAVAVTQGAYGIYLEGAESTSVLAAAQDTAPSIDVLSDRNVQVRVRLQSTSVAAIPSTDDFKLQWELNASGSWADVGATPLIDSYEDNTVGYQFYSPGGFDGMGQSFTGTGKKLTSASFLLNQTGTAQGTFTALIYAHVGTYGGTNSAPTGPPLATSTTTVLASTVPTTATWISFTFDGTFTPVAGTRYFICLETTTPGNISNSVLHRGKYPGGTHAGCAARRIIGSSYGANASDLDLSFRAYTSAAVIGLNSPALTDGGASTNRLTAGSGSFQAGKISEDGEANDVGWAGNNFTELVYSIQLVSAGLVAGDVVRFRVLKNGVTTEMTYTATPMINVTKSAGPFSLQGCTTWLDADDASTFTLSSGVNVEQWRDKSTKAYNYDVGGATRSTRNSTINGRTAVRTFPDGHVRVVPQAQSVTDDWAIFVVCQRVGTQPTAASIAFHNGDVTANGYGVGPRVASSDNIGFTRNQATYHASNIASVDSVPHVQMVGRVGGVTQHYINGVATNLNGSTLGAMTAPGVGTFIPSWVTTRGFTGDMCEVIMYERAVSPAEAALINNYLYARWVPLTPVSATRATTWTVRSTVAAATRATTWEVRSTVAAATRATTWAVLRAVAATRATTWNVLGLATVPDPPTSLQATPVVGGTSMDLDWIAPVDDGGSVLTDFIVEYRLVESVSEAVSPILMSANYGPQMQNTSFSIIKPPGLTAGETLLFISGTEDTGLEPLWTFPTSGWLKATGFPIHDTFAPHMWIQCYWKIADASDVALTDFVCTLNLNGYSYPHLSRITDHNGLSPVILTSWRRGDANTPKLVGGTTTETGLLVIGYGTSWESGPMQGSSDAYWTALPGTPSQGNVGFYQQQPTPGAFPDKDFGDTSLDFSGASVVMSLRGPSAYTDDFNRADGSLGEHWSAPNWGVISNGAGKTAGGNDFAVFLKNLSTTDMWAECTVIRDDNFTCLDVRMQGAGDGGAGGTSYLGFWDPAGWFALGKNLSGSWGGQFATTTGVPHPSLPYKMRLEAEGSTVRLLVNDVEVLSATDTSITTGKYAGANCGFTGVTAIDNYRCGPLPYVAGP